jgi:hypothetical protein
MKDYKLKLRNLHVSHILSWYLKIETRLTPKDRDEVNNRDVCECDG